MECFSKGRYGFAIVSGVQVDLSSPQCGQYVLLRRCDSARCVGLWVQEEGRGCLMRVFAQT
jgi:hypothetical protein